MIEAVWFRNAHEHRNDWVRFGFMRLHLAGRLRYQELPLSDCADHGFSADVAAHTHRHTSVLLLRDQGGAVRCILDSEDSLYWMSPLIADADLYFCMGFNRAFFQDRTMPQPYAWQRPAEVEFYRRRAGELVRAHGDHFHKARPLGPIGPSLAPRTPLPGWLTRWRKLRHRLATALSRTIYWRNEHADFERRYRQLLEFRRLGLRHDVVLSDTLWGWPRHRLALHRRLAALAARFDIHARLAWSAPSPMDGGDQDALDPAAFPIETGRIEDYEAMLAASRLGVFAIGFHWGWRNIVTFALMMGLPLYMDRPIAEFEAPWDAFDIRWNDAGDWSELAAHLEALDGGTWSERRAQGQAAFDRWFAPEVVAEGVIAKARAEIAAARQANA